MRADTTDRYDKRITHMDLTLNEFQTMLQTSAREFMEDQVPRTRVLEIDDSESGFDPNSLGADVRAWDGRL